MSKVITNILWIMVVLLIIYIVYDHFQREDIITTDLVPGDTITTVINQEVFDSLEYFFEAKLDSVRKTKVKWSTAKTVTDTVRLTDTLYLVYSSNFKLGTDTLGVKGKVTFYDETFGFRDIVFNNQQKIKTITDTLKTVTTEQKPFYEDSWFYATAGVVAILISLLLGGK